MSWPGPLIYTEVREIRGHFPKEGQLPARGGLDSAPAEGPGTRPRAHNLSPGVGESSDRGIAAGAVAGFRIDHVEGHRAQGHPAQATPEHGPRRGGDLVAGTRPP